MINEVLLTYVLAEDSNAFDILSLNSLSISYTFLYFIL